MSLTVPLVVALLAEVLLLFVCVQISFQQDLKVDKYMLGVIASDIILYVLVNFRILPVLFTPLFYGLIFVYIYYSFKQSIKRTLVRAVIGFSFCLVIQCLGLFTTNLIIGNYSPEVKTMTASVISLFYALLIKKCIPLYKKRKKKKSKTVAGKGVYGLIVLYVVVLVIVIALSYTNQTVSLLWLVTLMMFMILIVYSLQQLDQAQMDIEKKDYELEVQRVYSGAYQELLTEVRRRQHDYKNQLGAVYSSHLVAKTLDELVDMQRNYIEELQSDSRYDSILTNCDNSILAGYLYYRLLACHKEGVTVDYDIHVGGAECRFAMHEMIEILGILINNACENFNGAQEEGKRIKLVAREEEDKILFSVSNPTEYIKNSQIEKMFTPGYSSKGENRGLGLPRVAELVNLYQAQIKVTNVTYDGDNWIEFTIEIEK